MNDFRIWIILLFITAKRPYEYTDGVAPNILDKT